MFVPVTMRDVAQEAGVSIKTVSRVVNQQGELKDETRTRVLAAIDKLGYRPSKVARALVTSRTDTIGLLIGDIANPYFSEVARGVLDIAQECGYDVFLCNTDGKPLTEKRALYSLIDHNIDGAVIFPTWKNKDWIPKFAQLSCPLVLVNSRTEPQPGVSLVRTNMMRGAKSAVQYLIDQGHQHIAMIVGEVNPMEKINRVCGYRETLEANGLLFRQDWVILGDPVIEHGFAAAQELLSNFLEITAIFCYNDLLAMGAVQGCKALGLKIPRDIAILGFDNVSFSALVDPPLTTVHVDKYEIGRRSASLLLQMLKEPDQEFPVQYVDTELVVRESA
jgi:LacI family transcriptional regulator